MCTFPTYFRIAFLAFFYKIKRRPDMEAVLTFSVTKLLGKGKGKVFPLLARLWPRGWVEVKLYFSKTTALEGGEWSAARPGRTLPPRKTRYPLYRRLCGPQGRSGRPENLAPSGCDLRTVQPVVSSDTD